MTISTKTTKSEQHKQERENTKQKDDVSTRAGERRHQQQRNKWMGSIQQKKCQPALSKMCQNPLYILDCPQPLRRSLTTTPKRLSPVEESHDHAHDSICTRLVQYSDIPTLLLQTLPPLRLKTLPPAPKLPLKHVQIYFRVPFRRTSACDPHFDALRAACRPKLAVVIEVLPKLVRYPASQ